VTVLTSILIIQLKKQNYFPFEPPDKILVTNRLRPQQKNFCGSGSGSGHLLPAGSRFGFSFNVELKFTGINVVLNATIGGGFLPDSDYFGFFQIKASGYFLQKAFAQFEHHVPEGTGRFLLLYGPIGGSGGSRGLCPSVVHAEKNSGADQQKSQ
jgi:hypothetical protein